MARGRDRSEFRLSCILLALAGLTGKRRLKIEDVWPYVPKRQKLSGGLDVMMSIVGRGKRKATP